MDAQPLGQQHADTVLDRGEPARQRPEQQHLRPADLQQRQARPEADGREEGDHERRLERGVELEREHARLPQRER